MEATAPPFSTNLLLARTRRSGAADPGVVLDDVRQEAAALAAAGYAGAELPSPFLESWRREGSPGESFLIQLRQTFRDQGIADLTLHGPTFPDLETPLPDAVEQLEWHARLAADLGARCMVVHPTPHSHPHVASVSPRLLERDIEVIQAVADTLGDSGCRLAVENLPTYGIAYLDRLMGEAAGPAVGVCFDTGHWNVRPEWSLERVLERFGRDLVQLHLSDNDGVADQHLAPGRGDFTWTRWADSLPPGRVDWPWLLELDPVDPAGAEDFDAAWRQADRTRREAIADARRVLAGYAVGGDAVILSGGAAAEGGER